MSEHADIEGIWAAICESNAAWTSGRPDDTAASYAPDAAMIAPGLAGALEGGEAVWRTQHPLPEK